MDEHYLEKIKIMEEEFQSSSEGGWIPWNRAKELEGGEELLKEMVESGSVLTRRNVKLPQESKIPYPENQEVKYIEQRFSKKRRFVTRTSRGQAPGDLEDFDKDWGKQETQDNQNPTSKQSKDKQEPSDNLDTASKVATSNIKKAHQAWDAAKRDFDAVVSQSKLHPNTMQCKVVSDLSELVARGQAFDTKILLIESKAKMGERLSSDEITGSADMAKHLNEVIKTGKKKAQGLRTMFTL